MKQLDETMLDGLISAGEHVRAEAVNETPEDTSDLKKSALVTSDGKATVVVSYDTPYAVKQHEELGYNHPGGGKAKYLEDPFNREKDNGNIEKIVAQAVERKFF